MLGLILDTIAASGDATEMQSQAEGSTNTPSSALGAQGTTSSPWSAASSAVGSGPSQEASISRPATPRNPSTLRRWSTTSLTPPQAANTAS